jgi:pimeloyl-ACP methyl ester carboxylesterase
MRAAINGAELCVDAIGDASHPAVLLVMGAGGSMDRWEEPFCERLAAAGRYVIRYDQRDTGASTTCPPGEPDYSGDDLVADAVGVLDHLGIGSAHLAGLSAGGAIAQRVAIEYAGRVRSLTLLSTSPAGSGGPGYPELPPVSDELRAAFARGAAAQPDWSDREAAIAHLLEEERPYTGRRRLDEPALRELLGRVYDRSIDVASAGNHYLVPETELPRVRLGEIAVPTLVIHGTDDPLFPPAHGEALAREIPGARLLLVEGLGHELPRWAWDEVLPALVAITA